MTPEPGSTSTTIHNTSGSWPSDLMIIFPKFFRTSLRIFSKQQGIKFHRPKKTTLKFLLPQPNRLQIILKTFIKSEVINYGSLEKYQKNPFGIRSQTFNSKFKTKHKILLELYKGISANFSHKRACPINRLTFFLPSVKLKQRVRSAS